MTETTASYPTFRVFEPDGSDPDLERIALNEEWAKGLMYCDMEGFALQWDGTLLLTDECGEFRYCPMGRFRVEFDADAVTETTLPAVSATDPVPLSRDIIREIAMDVGKAVAHHIATLYPKSVDAASSTFLLSVRNTVHNEIMAATEVTDEDAILERLARNAAHRREINRLRKMAERNEAQRRAGGDRL